jgi:hypothetical protein
MNKKFLIVLGSMFLTFFLILGTVKAANVYYQAISGVGVASTTAVFQIGGQATTTKTFSSDGYGRVSYLISVGASTTPPTLCWRNEFSDNGTDWYAESVALNATATSTISVRTAREECWIYATTTDTSLFQSLGSDGKTVFIGKKIDIEGLKTGHTRTKFYLNNANRARVDVKTIVSNEVIITK